MDLQINVGGELLLGDGGALQGECCCEPPPPIPDIEAHWPLAGNALDVSGNGHNGTITAATPIVGQFGGGYNFNGTTAKIECGIFTFPLNAYTVTGWVRTSYSPGGAPDLTWLSNGNGGSGDAAVDTFILGGGLNGDGAGGTAWHGGSTAGLITDPTGNIRDNNWHMVAYSYEIGNQKLYVDGVLLGSLAAVDPLAVSGSPMTIGGVPFGGHQPWVGDIEEVYVYKTVASDAAILWLYNHAP